MADATVDVQRYMSNPPLARSEDPLAYWLNHRHRYTNLFKRAKRFLCMPASTVPCRRIFSKCGEIVSKKRNWLNPNTVEKTMYLKKNFQSTVTQEYPRYGIFYQHFPEQNNARGCTSRSPIAAATLQCKARCSPGEVARTATSGNHYKWFWNSQKLNLPIITFCPHRNQTNLPIFILLLLLFLFFHYLFWF